MLCDEFEVLEEGKYDGDCEDQPLFLLSASIKLISIADYVYFMYDWDKDKKCRIENLCAQSYGVQTIYEEKLEKRIVNMSAMFMFEGMFKPHIENSNLKMPENFANYNPDEYPHFHVFMLAHLGEFIDISSLENNANIIAAIPESDIKNVTLEELADKGVVYGFGDLV